MADRAIGDGDTAAEMPRAILLTSISGGS